jgi:ferritin-like metal-binding protein YciE
LGEQSFIEHKRYGAGGYFSSAFSVYARAVEPTLFDVWQPPNSPVHPSFSFDFRGCLLFHETGDAMSVKTLEELLVDELKDLYSAEKQIVRALPKLAKAASTPQLRDALESHLEETKGQVERLEQIAEIVGKKLTGKTCAGMKGVLEEGSEVLEEVEEGNVRDAAMIGAAQRVEHYEMAGYGTARDFAKLLGQEKIVELLEQTLEEEKAADQKLTTISKSVNGAAKAEMSHAA